MCCDGELTPEQSAALEQYLQEHPGDRECICNQMEAERALRDRVARVMDCCGPAPASLCQCIKDAFAAEPADEQHAADVAGRNPAAAKRSRRAAWLFSEPQSANIFAVAASLLLVVGAVLFGIYGRSIDDVTLAPASGNLVSDAALFVEQEHAAGASARQSTLTIEETAATLSRWLESPVSVFDLSIAGYEFVSAREVQMPGKPQRSAQLLYRKPAEPGQPSPMVSLFVVRDEGRCGEKLCEGLARGKWCCVSDQGIQCKRKVMRGTDGRLVYFLVCCDERDASKVANQIQLAATSPQHR